MVVARVLGINIHNLVPCSPWANQCRTCLMSRVAVLTTGRSYNRLLWIYILCPPYVRFESFVEHQVRVAHDTASGNSETLAGIVECTERDEVISQLG